MPTYNFRNIKTGEIIEEFMSISARDEFLEKNKHLEAYIDEAPMFSYSGAKDFSGGKTDNTFKEVMQKIAEKHPASSLAEKVLKKSTKEIKTRQALDKHRKRQTAANAGK
jgi:anaerobic ribonucleoside-triphosphate reductase